MLEIGLANVIYSIVNFLILLVLLRIFLYKPVRGMLETRKQVISDSLAAAEQAQKQAASAGEEIAAQLSQTRMEAEKIIGAARVAGEDLHQQIVEQARAEAQNIIATTRVALDKEREEAIAALRKDAAGLAVSMAERLLAGELTAEQQQAMLQKSIAQMGRLQ